MNDTTAHVPIASGGISSATPSTAGNTPLAAASSTATNGWSTASVTASHTTGMSGYVAALLLIPLIPSEFRLVGSLAYSLAFYVQRDARRRPPFAAPRSTAMVAVLIAAGAGCASDPPAAVVGLTVAGCPPGTAHGSGIVIEPGLVLTSAHVVKGATEIEVTNGDRSTTATVVGFDPDMDLAYLAVDGELGAPGGAHRRSDRGR